MSKNKYDIAIIGSGPAGMALALYLKRANKNFVLFERSAPGGKLNQIANVHNYLGLDNIAGPSLAYKFYENIASLGILINNEEVKNITKKNDIFFITTNLDKYESKIVVLANGLAPLKSKVPNFQKFFHKGISTCAICDGHLYKNQSIAVVGDNDIADEEYNYLKNITNKIVRINSKKEKIIEYFGKDNLEGIKTNKKTYYVSASFVYDEEYLDVSFLKEFNLKRKNERLLVDKNYRTNIEGLYAIGDVIEKPIYQIVGAINDASIVSSIIIHSLK